VNAVISPDHTLHCHFISPSCALLLNCFLIYIYIYIYILYIQGDAGGICTTLGNDSMSDSKQKNSYEHGSDFERLRSYGYF